MADGSHMIHYFRNFKTHLKSMAKEVKRTNYSLFIKYRNLFQPTKLIETFSYWRQNYVSLMDRFNEDYALMLKEVTKSHKVNNVDKIPKTHTEFLEPLLFKYHKMYEQLVNDIQTNKLISNHLYPEHALQNKYYFNLHDGGVRLDFIEDYEYDPLTKQQMTEEQMPIVTKTIIEALPATSKYTPKDDEF